MQERLEEMYAEVTALEAELRAFIERTLKNRYSYNWVKQARAKPVTRKRQK